MYQAQQQVGKFHQAFLKASETLPSSPTPCSQSKTNLNKRLITEEYKELLEALDCVWVQDAEYFDHVASEAVDLIYVTLGLIVDLGINITPIWNAIANANLEKISGGVKFRDDGKVLKPEGWKPADTLSLITDQLNSTHHANG